MKKEFIKKNGYYDCQAGTEDDPVKIEPDQDDLEAGQDDDTISLSEDELKKGRDI